MKFSTMKQELAEARNFTISHFKYISDYIPTTKTLSQIDKIIEETYLTTRSKDFNCALT